MATETQIEFPWKAIGYVRSPYSFKNGTPRQATVCKQSRGIITIDKSVFNNPEHSLEGLQEFTHIWILFIFHKNNNQYSKAKVKPPRLNGGKVGLFSTRSPYRPNNVGLTLAKIETIQGASVTVSGIDILDGTPVIDIKPYIPQYDCPELAKAIEESSAATNKPDTVNYSIDPTEVSDIHDQDLNEAVFRETDTVKLSCEHNEDRILSLNEQHDSHDDNLLHKLSSSESCNTQQDNSEEKSDKKLPLHTGSLETLDCGAFKKCSTNVGVGELNSNTKVTEDLAKDDKDDHFVTESDSDNYFSFNEKERTLQSTAAEWIASPPVSTLEVRFTPRSLTQLAQFSETTDNQLYKLKFLKSADEARQAIIDILHEDPRSVYRRNKCVDSLYYFTLDVIHVTCWFDTDNNQDLVEVVRIKSAYDVGSHSLKQ